MHVIVLGIDPGVANTGFGIVAHDRGRLVALDGEWPAVRAGFEAWLDAANFDADGRQRRSLESVRG